MSIEVFTCDQNTPEWYAARLGIPTASCFKTVRASGRGGGESKTRDKYMRDLAMEVLTSQPMESYRNEVMERGTELEPEARMMYAGIRDVAFERVGFIRNNDKRCGCSPDGLIGADGMVEFKVPLPATWAEVKERVASGDGPPPEYYAQLQGNLYVAKREWIDFVAYCPNLPSNVNPLVVERTHRDERYIAELAAAIDKFNTELLERIERLRR